MDVHFHVLVLTTAIRHVTEKCKMQFNHYDSIGVEMCNYNSAEQLSICNYESIKYNCYRIN